VPVPQHIDDPDLTEDSDAVWAVKDELVTVEFAVAAGTLESAVGSNRYEPGDALLTGSTGDRWCVSRARFDAKYRAEPPTHAGHSGRYLLSGAAGDWLMQYAPGDYGIVAQDRFVSVYRVLDESTSCGT